MILTEKISPQAAAKKFYREKGWEIEDVERRIKPHITKDAFGFGDLLMYNVALKQTALVQVTDGSHGANRKNKILSERRAAEWLACGNKIFLCLLVTKIHTVQTGKNRGEKRKSFEVRHVNIMI